MEKEFKLTEEQKKWFGDRMHEGPTGRVIVPSHLYAKYRKLSGREFMPNHAIKTILIDQCY